MTYLPEPIVNASTLVAPSSSRVPSSVFWPVQSMAAGSLMSISCTPSSTNAATMAYVPESIVNVSTPFAAWSSLHFVETGVSPSSCESLATMTAGLLMSISWTPLSLNDATMAYVLESIVNVSTSIAPPSSGNVTESVSASSATMAVGSLTSISWTPLSPYDATMAYVLEPITNVSTPRASSSTVNPFNPSVSASLAIISLTSHGPLLSCLTNTVNSFSIVFSTP